MACRHMDISIAWSEHTVTQRNVSLATRYSNASSNRDDVPRPSMFSGIYNKESKDKRYTVECFISTCLLHLTEHYLPWFRKHTTRAISSPLGEYSAHKIKVYRQLEPLRHNFHPPCTHPCWVGRCSVNAKFVQLFYTWLAVGIKPQTFWSSVQRPIHLATYSKWLILKCLQKQMVILKSQQWVLNKYW